MRRLLLSVLFLMAPFRLSADETPIARVGNVNLTESTLKSELKTELYEAEKNIYDLKKNWIEAKAKDILFTETAKARGMTKEAWVKTFIEEKIAIPTQAEVDEFLKKYPEDAKKDPSMAKRVVDYLTGQRRAQKEDELFAELKKTTPVQILLTEPTSPYKAVEYFPENPSMGPAKAPVTIVEFTDFECPYCQQSQEALHKVESTYKNKVKIVARQFPLQMHSRARPAAEAALCAHEQGKFWPFREKVFGEKKLEDADFLRYAKDIKLDETKFKSCLSEHRSAAQVTKDIAEGESYGVRGTPHFFINGVTYNGSIPFEQFRDAIEAELKKK